MLEKIVNISAGSDYKQSSKSGSYSKVSRYLSDYHPSGNDSISLSPATSYLSVIGWKLKKILIDKEKIHIGFSFDNFDFSTAINPNDISQMHRIDYTIKYSLDTYTGMVDLNIKISSVLVSEKQENIQVKLHLPQLKKFLESVFSSSGYNSALSSENFEVQQVFTSMENELNREFNYVNGRLISFLEKFLTIKINLNQERTNFSNKLELDFLQIKKT